ncbi:hypothetical protein EQG49_07165 [Periweissella cryptocerci]|uniref:Uncharacterized protein n=2 Tax=Periweissella cryptocerci TaxID=2506420 RepID=A0A4P6YU06_9LACO|nr:hypothetical protein EQG49_07165 [Periweissella cryptocerci]
MYFIHLFGGNILLHGNSRIELPKVEFNYLTQILIIVGAMAFYLLGYKALIGLAVKARNIESKAYTQPRLYGIKNIFYIKIFREISNNSKGKILISVISFPTAILIIKILDVASIIEIRKINFATLLAVSLMAQTSVIANFIFTNISIDSQIIKIIVQARYDLRGYLLKKAKLAYLTLLISAVIVSFVLLGTKFVNNSGDFLLLIAILAGNALPLAFMSQIFPNLILCYSSKESFESSIALPLSLTIIYVHTMIETMIILMSTILKTSVYWQVTLIVSYITVSLISNILLFIFMRRRYYGEYRKFVK